ncbi:hypothetical protein AV545_23490 [Paenibacillus jamilae]|uniref:helix-turn-helix domain-containing protein n=1 Tax=Paenibacillus jamilae TaxID=114136 RepID=UPI0007AB82FA|nr:helix-turn-helix domain-containing protein [Paenibacillus jamilae]KZE67265.1 hypothetical protein AV545_23490 [Paenibacillus jamilae]
MIINSKTVSLTEAATMLGKSEQEVLRLSQYGYLEQSKPESGKTRIIVNSLEKYARRSGIALQEAPTPSHNRLDSLSVQETMTKLGLQTESAVHRLIQAGRLKAGFEGGAYIVNAQSLHDYVTGRC